MEMDIGFVLKIGGLIALIGVICFGWFKSLRLNSILVDAVRSGNVEAVKRAIEKGASVHTDRDYPIKYAAAHGNTSIVQWLILAGAYVRSENDTALRWAAEKGCTDIVQILLENGANVHACKDEALISAAKRGYFETVWVLLNAGADVHSANDFALIKAAEKGYLETVKVLLSEGANIHTENDLPLIDAADRGHIEVVRVLLDAGANVHAEGDFALTKAVDNVTVPSAEPLDAKDRMTMIICSSGDATVINGVLVQNRIHGRDVAKASKENPAPIEKPETPVEKVQQETPAAEGTTEKAQEQDEAFKAYYNIGKGQPDHAQKEPENPTQAADPMSGYPSANGSQTTAQGFTSEPFDIDAVNGSIEEMINSDKPAMRFSVKERIRKIRNDMAQETKAPATGAPVKSAVQESVENQLKEKIAGETRG